MTQQDTQYDVVIVGQGAAGFAAGLYSARYQLKTAIFGETFGGETAIGGIIENYPGYVGIDGFELMMNMKEQVQGYGANIVDERVEKVLRHGDCFEVTTTEGVYTGVAVIIAVGRERRKLGLEHEEEWTGKGVSYCSTCDAPLYRGKTAGVVGGGDAAVKGAALLAKYADHVHVIYRGETFTRPEPTNVERLKESSNVDTMFETNVVQLKGSDGLDGVGLDRPHNGSADLDLDGIFIEIGADPRVELAHQLGVELNEKNEINVDTEMRTNVHGVFAAGDVTNASGELKQTVTAVAQGAIAATSAYTHVAAHPDACAVHAVGYDLG